MNINFQLYVLLVVSCFFSTSCDSEDTFDMYIALADPKYEWLIEMVEEEAVPGSTAEQYRWYKSFTHQHVEYVVSGSCCPTCFWIPVYYNCDGTIITFPNDELQEINEAWRNGTFIWKGSDCK